MVRKTILYVVAWFAAGVSAVALATAGVSMVGNQVTGSRPSPLSADEVRSELAADGSAAATLAESPTTTSLAPGAVTTPPTTGSPTATTPTSRPDDSRPPATTTPTTTQAPAVTRTYVLIGGTATLRFTASGVTVVDATPKGGYSVDVEPTHDTGVRVEFRTDDHRSRVEGWWDGGPQDETSEES